MKKNESLTISDAEYDEASVSPCGPSHQIDTDHVHDQQLKQAQKDVQGRGVEVAFLPVRSSLRRSYLLELGP